MKKQFLHLGITVSLLLSLFACASNPTLGMKSAADAFLQSLDAKQKAKAQADFSSKDRTDWVFLPDKYIKPEKKRFGLTLKEMSAEQRKLGMGLLHAALSAKGKLTV
ncbi:MAG: DUF3500 domain-containing protein, partial [Lentisphaeraceae bacterium]|nr:DUF3500 domain-containing protein [Lentisphaeraceae bacterium]